MKPVVVIIPVATIIFVIIVIVLMVVLIPQAKTITPVVNPASCSYNIECGNGSCQNGRCVCSGNFNPSNNCLACLPGWYGASCNSTTPTQ
jgi:hypothetical protein